MGRHAASGHRTVTLYRVVRPDGTRIDAEPGINREVALWNARELDARLERLVQKNRTNNVTCVRRAGYTFLEVRDVP